MKKKIWVIKSGEPLIFDSDCERLLRSSTLAHCLDKKKYDVSYFVDSFNHFKKKFRLNKPKSYDFVNYFYLNGCGYNKNKSVLRLIHNFIISVHFILMKKKNQILYLFHFHLFF